jgi:Protein of unknown function (DUF3313)
MPGRATSILVVAMLLVLGGCAAQTESVDRPMGVDPGVALQASIEEPGAWTYKAAGVDLAAYHRFILDPPRVFRGEGASFGDLSDAQVRQIGGMFVEETRKVLGTEYPVVTQPGPGVARLRFTIIGVTETVPYISTATRVIPIGAAINLLSQGAGRGGTLTGSVTYGVEAFDSQSGELVAAAVRRLTPGAFDISSTLGTMDTAQAVARDAAAKLRATLDGLHP